LHSYDFEFDPPVPDGEHNRLSPPSDPVGKYMLHERSVGEAFQPSDLSTAPVVEIGKGMVKWQFPLEKQPELVNLLNADSRVDVCLGSCILENVRLLSVVCSSMGGAECYAVVEIPSAESAKLAPEKNYRVIPRQY